MGGYMSSFTSPLIVSPMPDGRYWQLVEEFDYAVGSKESNDKIHVPKGFVTDFASVPRPFWWLFPPWGKYGKAAVVHDYLYQYQLRTRREADDIFLEGMLVLGVEQWQARLMYRSVRCFAWLAWH
jgi:hypothetical protein